MAVIVAGCCDASVSHTLRQVVGPCMNLLMLSLSGADVQPLSNVVYLLIESMDTNLLCQLLS